MKIPSSGSRVVAWEPTDIRKIIVSFPNFVDVPIKKMEVKFLERQQMYTYIEPEHL
jgi:hypothetical protein